MTDDVPPPSTFLCATGVAQIAAGGNGPAICFSVAVVIWTILGIIVGQIRSLQGLGLLANSSVWLVRRFPSWTMH